MKKIVFILAVAVAIALLGLNGYQMTKNRNLGATMTVASSYHGATNTSSSIPFTATTTNPILSRDESRTNALVCNNGVYPVFLHPLSVATTTGVEMNEGTPLFAHGLTTSTQDVCRYFPGFKGYLFGISATNTFVTVSSWK